MSLRNKILNELVTQHPDACNVLVNLVKAIDLEVRTLSCHDEIKSFDIGKFDEWTTSTIDNLALSDATPIESDHAFRVMNSLFVDLNSKGVTFVSVKDEEAIKRPVSVCENKNINNYFSLVYSKRPRESRYSLDYLKGPYIYKTRLRALRVVWEDVKEEISSLEVNSFVETYNSLFNIERNNSGPVTREEFIRVINDVKDDQIESIVDWYFDFIDNEFRDCFYEVQEHKVETCRKG